MVGIKLLYAFIIFVIAVLFAIGIIYISDLNMRLKTVNSQNVKMLDGMHEGILILSKAEQTTMFCNKSAQRLLQRAIQHKFSDEEIPEHHKDAKQET